MSQRGSSLQRGMSGEDHLLLLLLLMRRVTSRQHSITRRLTARHNHRATFQVHSQASRRPSPSRRPHGSARLHCVIPPPDITLSVINADPVPYTAGRRRSSCNPIAPHSASHFQDRYALKLLPSIKLRISRLMRIVSCR